MSYSALGGFWGSGQEFVGTISLNEVKRMKYAVLILFAMAALPVAGQKAKKAAPFMCSYTQKPDTMYSWALDHPPVNMPGIHYETRTIKQGALLSCDGTAGDNNPGCSLVYTLGAIITLSRGGRIRSPSTDVEMHCTGNSNLCCSIKIGRIAKNVQVEQNNHNP
jgi:hypothetical protein